MKMPLLPIEERKTTFKEVELGFTQEQALTESNRCLQCANPSCVTGCPARVDIPGFIKAFREGDLVKSAEIIKEKNFFPSICGRICQHERQCEGACILAKTKDPISIGGLERFIGDNSPLPKKRSATKKNIAVIGSGPSGLSAAAYLSQAGMHVTVFENSNSFGGVIKYGVPEFRLPKEAVAKELSVLHELGIDFEPNSKTGEESLETLSKRFDAVFVGTGVGKARDLDLPGSSLKGIMSAMKFLVNLNQSGFTMIASGEKVVVVGAGYVGIDAARSALRCGGEVTCITIGTREAALKTVAAKDYEEAEQEGVHFMFGLKVTGFDGKENVERVRYVNHVEGELIADKVIYAIGQAHDDDPLKAPLRTAASGCIEVNSQHQTTIPNVFAAGDCVHGPKTVIQAIATGRDAAKSMLDYLNTKQANEALGIGKEAPEKIMPKVDVSNKDI